PLIRGVGELGPFCRPSRLFQPPPTMMMHAAAAAKTRPGKLPPKMKKLRQQFQADNELPVFLKGGSMDSILYKLTLVLCVIGTLGDVFLWFGYILA
ncbi:hypothetical protein KR018_010305, partial [Drosophila ironensis]